MKILFFFLVIITTVRGSIAQTGIADPAMQKPDSLVKQFLKDYDIPGASIALAKDGKIVYMRGFGFANLNRTEPTQPSYLFRIASLSKQITSIAIMKLIEDGLLNMTDRVFGLHGLLQYHPVLSKATITDDRIYDITVQQLLEHSAGWDRDSKCNPNPTLPYSYFVNNCDPINMPLRVAMFTQTPNPISKHAMAKYVLEKGLDFTPGTRFSYSNMGYLLLGEIIEQLTGLDYEHYIQKNILHPLGIFDMHLAKNLLTNKQEREVEYNGNGYKTLSCYNTGELVPWEYGGFNMEAMDAYGGWITTARDLLTLLVAADGFASKKDLLKPATIQAMTTPSVNNPYYAKGWFVSSNNNWWHTGAIDGTACEQVRTNNGYTWVILLNKRQLNNSAFWRALDNLGWSCISSTKSWPCYDLMLAPSINASNLTLKRTKQKTMMVSWDKGNSDKYLLIASEDSPVNAYPENGKDYAANNKYGLKKMGNNSNYVVYNGSSNEVMVSGLLPGKTYYFRLISYNKNIETGQHTLYQLGDNPVAKIKENKKYGTNFIMKKNSVQSSLMKYDPASKNKIVNRGFVQNGTTE
ncbi:MAG: serine hydrolase [Bacteroidota bacterium]